MKKTIIIFILLLIGVISYSQSTIRKGYYAIQNNDTASLLYTNGEWKLLSDTTLTIIIDTIKFIDGSKLSTAIDDAAKDTFYLSGQNVWIGMNDTASKIDTSNYAYKSDSSNYTDTAGVALNAIADSLFHLDSQQWLSVGDTIPKADSSRVTQTGDTLLYNLSVKFTGESGTYIDSNSVTTDTTYTRLIEAKSGGNITIRDDNGSNSVKLGLFTDNIFDLNVYSDANYITNSINMLMGVIGGTNGYFTLRNYYSSNQYEFNFLNGLWELTTPSNDDYFRLSDGDFEIRLNSTTYSYEFRMTTDVEDKEFSIYNTDKSTYTPRIDFLAESGMLRHRVANSGGIRVNHSNNNYNIYDATGSDTLIRTEPDYTKIFNELNVDTIDVGNVEILADADTLKSVNFWVKFKGFIGNIFTAQKITTDTLILGDSTMTGIIQLDEALESATPDSMDVGLMKVDRIERDTTYHIIGGYEDSTITVTIASSSTWYKATNGTDSTFIELACQGISINYDTIVFEKTGAYRGMISITFSATSGNEIEFRLYNVTQASQIAFKQGQSAAGASSYDNLSFPIYEDITAGDEIILQVQNISASNNVTLRHIQFEIVYLHE